MKAKCGLDYIRNQDWIPMEKGSNGWKVWANKEARKMSINGFTFNAVISKQDGYLRINFAGQPERII